MTLSDEDVREILRLIDESDLDELRIETEGFALHVLRGGPVAGGPEGTTAAPPQKKTRGGGPADTTAPEAPKPDDTLTIAAPMLGTFYRAEGPGQDPFVEVGSEVGPDTTVCIIEVMKMMNSVPAGVAGTVVAVCPQNAELVEYGAPLFRVEPTA